MNANWDSVQKCWIIRLQNSHLKYKWVTTWQEGVYFLFNGIISIQNNMMIVPHNIPALRDCAVRGFPVLPY